MIKSEISKPKTFLYFAYAENLWKFRMHMYCPTAEFVSIARLDNYRVDFIRYSHFWGGPTATLVPTANAQVWGVIWRLHVDDKKKLDEQKCMDHKKYYIAYFNVLTPHMGYFNCRSYVQKINPQPRGDKDPIPVENWPSWTMKEVMIMGSKQHGAPEYYINNLKKMMHNGEEGWLRAACLLIRYGRDERCLCPVPGRIPRAPWKLNLMDNKKEAGRKLKWT